MVLYCEKVCFRYIKFYLFKPAIRTCVFYSTQLVHANAKHILTTHTTVRRGIDLYPHQLVASKTVTRTHRFTVVKY